MNKIRSIIIMACLLVPAALTRAEVAKWIIKPMASAIARMDNSHFKVWNEDKCGVFNSQGKQVVPFMADSITDFVGDVAVVLREQDGHNRLLNVLHTDGSVFPVYEEVYVDENPFVGTDRLLVTDRKGKELFLDLAGKKMKEKVHRDNLPPASPEPELEFVANGPIPFEVNDEYGYYYGQEIFLPEQFSEAQPFSNGYAIAADHTGRYGLLRLLDDDVRIIKTRREAPEDYIHENIKLKLHVPEELGNDIITVMCTDVRGQSVKEDSYSGGTDREVPLKLAAGRYVVNVLLGDLQIYTTSFTSTPPAKPKPQEKVQPKPATQASTTTTRTAVSSSAVSAASVQIAIGARTLKANAKDCASFTITITNNGNETLTTPVRVSGKGVVCATKQVTVKPHSSRSVTATFTGIKGKESRTVTVTAQGKTVSRTIALNPFFTEF
ncbi:MAG: WG repeat-containing protein [Muribaculaceae bacterium]|nr:WG repeat-containing protein [Muribaculaceae bacterium]